MSVNWGAMIQANNALWDRTNNTVERLFGEAREAQQRQRLAEVVTAAQSGNPDAMRQLYAMNPQLAMQMEDALYQRGERQRADTARTAMSALLLGGQMPPPPAFGPQAEPTGTVANPAQPVQGVDPLAPLPDPAAQQQPEIGPEQHREWEQYIGQLAAWADTPEKWDQAVDYFSAQGFEGAAQFKGQFSPEGRAALMQRGGITEPEPPGGVSDPQRQLIEADPEGFLTFQGKRLDVTAKQLKGMVDLNNAAMQLLGSVHDQPTYEDAKRRASQLYSSFGQDASEFLNGLPPQYSPETVRMLQLRGMDTSKQLAAIARENNIESQIEVREQRADEYARHNRAMESNQRRGQDRRGGGRSTSPKAPTPTTVIGRIMDKQARGQALTPAEQATLEEYRGGRGGRRGGRSGGGVVTVRTISEARELPPGTLFRGPDGKIRRR